MGNLRSVTNALERVGERTKLARDTRGLAAADKIVLPGVGAFGQAMANLRVMGLLEPLVKSMGDDKPLLGICLGFQLLFAESEEHGHHLGLGVFRGRVRRFPTGVKIPHIGWNTIQIERTDPLLAGIPGGTFFYFLQSYYAEPEDRSIVAATTAYGGSFASVVSRGKIFGVQFHPEKSQDAGLKLLENFTRL